METITSVKTLRNGTNFNEKSETITIRVPGSKKETAKREIQNIVKLQHGKKNDIKKMSVQQLHDSIKKNRKDADIAQELFNQENNLPLTGFIYVKQGKKTITFSLDQISKLSIREMLAQHNDNLLKAAFDMKAEIERR